MTSGGRPALCSPEGDSFRRAPIWAHDLAQPRLCKGRDPVCRAPQPMMGRACLLNQWSSGSAGVQGGAQQLRQRGKPGPPRAPQQGPGAVTDDASQPADFAAVFCIGLPFRSCPWDQLAPTSGENTEAHRGAVPPTPGPTPGCRASLSLGASPPECPGQRRQSRLPPRPWASGMVLTWPPPREPVSTAQYPHQSGQRLGAGGASGHTRWSPGLSR